MTNCAPEINLTSQAVPEKVNLLGLDENGLKGFFAELGEKPFRAVQIRKWIYHRFVTDFDEMTDLSRSLREKLKHIAEVRLPEVVLQQQSNDGTRKWVLRMDGGNSIETVFIPERQRGTLCVSSQVGCALDCAFCSTARQGFNRNLSAAEIIGQVWFAARTLEREEGSRQALTNVVLMGMGEPLMNFKNVMPAVTLMMDDMAFGLSKRRVTISTAGVVPYLKKMKDETDVSLAVSLHATTNELRDKLVPVNKLYPLEELLPACADYIDGKLHRTITWEYVMLDGVNDSIEDAKRLVKLVEGIPSKINLIPFNPFPDSGFSTSKPEVIRRFSEIISRAGLTVTTRKTRGDDIDAACGQLVGKVENRIKVSKLRQ